MMLRLLQNQFGFERSNGVPFSCRERRTGSHQKSEDPVREAAGWKGGLGGALLVDTSSALRT